MPESLIVTHVKNLIPCFFIFGVLVDPFNPYFLFKGRGTYKKSFSNSCLKWLIEW